MPFRLIQYASGAHNRFNMHASGARARNDPQILFLIYFVKWDGRFAEKQDSAAFKSELSPPFEKALTSLPH